MRAPAGQEVAAALEPYLAEGERIAVVDGDLWVHFPHGQGSVAAGRRRSPRRGPAASGRSATGTRCGGSETSSDATSA